MKQTLQLNLSQQLQLNPQLQQSMKLLQLSHADLQQEIHYQLETNPLLCLEGTKESLTTQEMESHDISFASRSHYPDFDAQINNASNEQTLADKLEFQLELSHLSERDKTIGFCIIENLDSQGYLKTSNRGLRKQLKKILSEPVANDEVIAVTHWIQQLQPLGCSTRDLKAFLSLQLNQIDSSSAKTAHNIIEYHFDALAKHQYAKIQNKLKLSSEQFSQAHEVILNLRKQPNYQGLSQKVDYVQPDAQIIKNNDQWQLQMLENQIPNLAINRQYAEILNGSSNEQDQFYLKQYLPKAKSFIKNLSTRKHTLQNVYEFIVEHQQDFFEQGKSALKPLRLQDISQTLGLHESTISRAVQNKFLQTPNGVIEFKTLFSNCITNSQGGEWSSTAIKSKIKSLIAAEPSRKPLTDSSIVRLLKQEGIQIARRTIAKYRETLNIPSSSQRKLLNNI